jgi:hypothetical protein
MNYFGMQALQLLSHQLIEVFIILTTNETCNEYFFSLFANLLWYLGIICMHMDRFLAIFWDIHYQERVTTSRAITLCCLNILASGILASLAKIIDSEYSTCTSPEIIVYTRRTNILVDGLMKLLIAAVTVVVTTYVVVKKKLAFTNVVHIAATNLNISTVAKESVEDGIRRLAKYVLQG